MTKDMTRGTPWKLIVQFALPIMAGNLLQQLYNTADTIIVGNFNGQQAPFRRRFVRVIDRALYGARHWLFHRRGCSDLAVFWREPAGRAAALCGLVNRSHAALGL